MRVSQPELRAAIGAVTSALASLLLATAAAAQTPGLSGLGFMAGCWEGSFGPASSRGVIEERYTPPSSNVMLGTTRYLRDGATVQFELTAIRAGDAGIALLPYPNGRPSEHAFRLTRLEPGDALFEAPEHDYPKRIRYRLLAWGSLRASIDGGADDPEPRTWTMRRADCDI